MFAIARAWAIVGAQNSRLLSAVAGISRQPAGEASTSTETGPAQPAAPGSGPEP